jgi:prepilin-type N-terminal cleavage/methylation domain-containing protein
MHYSRRAFTLIELLTVVALIAVLAALVLAVVKSGREQARKTQAVNQIRRLGIASQLYAGDNGGRLPGSQHSGNSWVGGLLPYLGLDRTSSPEMIKKVYRSPGDTHKTRLYSYAINDFLLPMPSGARDLNYSMRSRIEAQSQTLLFTETRETHTGSDHFHFARYGYHSDRFTASVATDRYDGGNVYLFVDGRVQWMHWSEVQPLLGTSGERFIHPEGKR